MEGAPVERRPLLGSLSRRALDIRLIIVDAVMSTDRPEIPTDGRGGRYQS